jgi:phosphoglycolate phosphatase-like HAD superfamily hydrolase
MLLLVSYNIRDKIRRFEEWYNIIFLKQILILLQKRFSVTKMSKKRFNCVLFDIDATLIRTPDYYIDNIFSHVFDDLGIKGNLDTKKRLWYSHKRDEIVKEIYSDVHKFWDTLYRQQKKSMAERKDCIEIYSPKDLETLGCLKYRLGAKLGIVSGGSKELVDASVSELGRGKFDYVVHIFNNHEKKADGILECMCKLGAERDKTIYVGNDDGDVIASNFMRIKSGLMCRDHPDEIGYFSQLMKSNYRFKELSEILRLF